MYASPTSAQAWTQSVSPSSQRESTTAGFTLKSSRCPSPQAIKQFGGKTVYRGTNFVEYLARWQRPPNAPEMVLLYADMSEADMARLYTAATCLIHPYRGEGFGLPIAEAMACGLPVIVPRFGSCLDFCADDTAYFVPAVEVPVPEEVQASLAASGLAPAGWPSWA